MVQIHLFGGVAVATDGGLPVDVGPAKCQTVLAALALSVPSPVPVSRLVELVWGRHPPRTAHKTLQWYVAHLRKSLGPDAIVRSGAAYRLDVEADAVDVARFRRLLDSGDIAAALAEWTGPPLAGLDAPGLTATVDGLVERWLGAVEIALERLVDADPGGAVGPLTELTANHPFREGLWGLLMTALYRVGRQVDALAAFHKARQRLVDELGIEPGPRLRELESLILEHDERLRGGASKGAASGRPTGTVTFGFCDIDDSTRLWADHREQAAMARLDELVLAAVERHGGYVFATAAPSFGVAFHRADHAAAWATGLQAAVGSESWPGGLEVRVGIGLHTGETEERNGDYLGAAVHMAARLVAAGHGGQTLVSEVTSSLLHRGDLHDLGTFRLDDVVGDRRVFQFGEGEHPPLRSEGHRRGNLPPRRGRLIGRDEQLKAIGDALATHPIVTLVGPGGIGKTRLAEAVAWMTDGDADDEAWLVEFADIASSSAVPQVVADALGVKERAGSTLTQSIVSALRARHALLVLDNCEHVVEGAATLVCAVAEGCADVRVLATSRERLGVADEQLVVVAPLDPASGVELFNERARAVSRIFDPHGTHDDVEELCRRLDGVPLAIELAAARTSSLAPSDLVERLDDRLRLLTGGRRTGAGRHRTLRATIQWSYDLLTPPQQVLLQRLSIFAGPFDLAGAEAVAADTELDAVDVVDLLGGLVERSMLNVESGAFGRRFRLLETIRRFAAEHLAVNGPTNLIAQRHAGWCLDTVTHIHQLLTGPAEIEGVARLGEVWSNLRAAVGWACATRDHRLAFALARPVAAEVSLRSQHEIGDWAERILAVTPPADEQLLILGLTWAAHRYQQTGDHDAYERLVRRHGEPDHLLLRYARAYVHDDDDALVDLAPQAVAELRRQGQHHLAAHAEIQGAGPLMTAGRFEEVDVLVAALAQRYRAQGPPTFLQWTLVTLGYSALFQGRHDRAEQCFDESADVDIPDRTLSASKPLEARAAFRRGDRSRAFRVLHSHIDELLATDNVGAGAVCVEFINMMATIDRLPDASRMLGYLETLDRFGALSLSTVVAGAASKIAASTEQAPDPERAAGRELDARQALASMRDVLGELADDRQLESPGLGSTTKG